METYSGHNRSSVAPRRKVAWSWGSVHWRTVVSSVQWGTLVVTLLCTLVPYLIIRYYAVSVPHERAFLKYDADISHPMFPNTVKGWMAPVFTFLLLFITVAFGEFVLMRHLHASLTSQLSVLLYVTIDSVLSYWATLLFTQVLKMHVGVLRPDFLERCQPDTSAFANGFKPTFGSMIVPPCRSPPSAELTDGHYAFPSGHASASANFEFYLAVYFLWTVFYRRCFASGDNVEALVAASRSGCTTFMRDVGEGLALLWIIFNLGVTWAIGATRVTDNKHHVADVVAGMFLGGMIATMFALRAIPRVRGMMEVAGPGLRKAPDDNRVEAREAAV